MKNMDPTAAKAEILRFIEGLPDGTRIAIDRPEVEVPPKDGYRQYKPATWMTVLLQEPTEPPRMPQVERSGPRRVNVPLPQIKAQRSGRLAMIAVAPELIGAMLAPKREIHVRLTNGLRDIGIIGAMWYGQLLLLIESPDLAEVAEGDMVPYFEPKWQTIYPSKLESPPQPGPFVSRGGSSKGL